MTAQQAKAKLLAVIKELSDAGFSVGGHWDDDVVILISRINGADYNQDDYAEIGVEDLLGFEP